VVRSLLLLAVLFAAFSRVRAASEDLPGSLQCMAVDSAGHLYGITTGWHEQVGMLENGAWRKIAVPAQPNALLALRDGRVAVLCLAQNQWSLVFLTCGVAGPATPLPWNAEPSVVPSRLFEDSHGAVWISARSSQVLRVRGSDVRAFELSSQNLPAPSPRWNLVMITEDLRGGIWIWCRDGSASSFSGAMRIAPEEGDSLVRVENLTGKGLVTILPRDHDSVWVADRTTGLYVLPLDTMRLEKVEPPAPDAFSYLATIKRFGPDLLVVAGSVRQAVVWKLAGGQWTALTADEDVTVASGLWHREPAYAQVSSGALLGLNRGALFVPREGAHLSVFDWKSGFPLTALRQIVPLGGDRFAASANDTLPRWMEGSIQDFLPKRSLASAKEISSKPSWAVDSRDRIFTFFGSKPTALSVWADGQWTDVPFPPGWEYSGSVHLSIDGRDRVWIIPENDNGSRPVPVFSADRKTWKVWPDFRAALVGNRADLGPLLREREARQPALGPKGTIAYRSPYDEIFFWNGHDWRSWPLTKIVAQPTSGERLGAPFFNGQGALCVNSTRSDRTWQFDGAEAWQGVPKISGPSDNPRANPMGRASHELPEHFTPADIQAPWVVTDNRGMVWVAGKKNLYRSYHGKTVAVFREGETQPFLTNPPIGEVRVDRFGNTWIRLGNDQQGRHVMLPPAATKSPEVKLLADQWGLVRMTSTITGDVEWRVAGAPWERVPAGETALGYLPAGDHQLEINVIDPELNLSSQSQHLKIKAPGQRDHLLEILENGPAASRELAAEGLARYGASVIPVLQKRIAQSKGDAWWLRAVLQECQARNR